MHKIGCPALGAIAARAVERRLSTPEGIQMKYDIERKSLGGPVLLGGIVDGRCSIFAELSVTRPPRWRRWGGALKRRAASLARWMAQQGVWELIKWLWDMFSVRATAGADDQAPDHAATVR